MDKKKTIIISAAILVLIIAAGAYLMFSTQQKKAGTTVPVTTQPEIKAEPTPLMKEELRLCEAIRALDPKLCEGFAVIAEGNKLSAQRMADDCVNEVYKRKTIIEQKNYCQSMIYNGDADRLKGCDASFAKQMDPASVADPQERHFFEVLNSRDPSRCGEMESINGLDTQMNTTIVCREYLDPNFKCEEFLTPLPYVAENQTEQNRTPEIP